MSAHPDQRASLLTIGLLILLGVVTLPGGIGELIARLHAPAMSTREADAVTAGYYEDLLDATAVRGSVATLTPGCWRCEVVCPVSHCSVRKSLVGVCLSTPLAVWTG